MLDNLLSSLARLASLSYQEKYIFNATEEYVIPEELLEDFDGAMIELRSNTNSILSKEQERSLASLADYITGNSGEALTFESRTLGEVKMRYGRAWIDLRRLAGVCLAAFQIRMDDLTMAAIESGKVGPSSL